MGFVQVVNAIENTANQNARKPFHIKFCQSFTDPSH